MRVEFLCGLWLGHMTQVPDESMLGAMTSTPHLSWVLLGKYSRWYQFFVGQGCQTSRKPASAARCASSVEACHAAVVVAHRPKSC